MENYSKTLRAAGPLIACLGTAWLGAQFRPGAWYEGLQKPPFTPPNIAFPIAWSILYTGIAIAGFLGSRRGEEGRSAMRFYYLQLALNALWTPLFFGMQSPLIALIEILILLVAIVWTIRSFWRISPLSAYLMLPYLSWVTFATYLTAGIVYLN